VSEAERNQNGCGGIYAGQMANVTVKDVPDQQLAAVTLRAKAEGLSTQAYLRRLIARDAAIPVLPDQLRELMATMRAERTPMSMEEFDDIRRGARRYQ
jgi:hypothetical protein